MTREELIRLLESATYKFAKTMPRNPHWYTLRRTWDDDALFDRAVQAIRDLGEKRRFFSKHYIYFDANGYTYWTMGSPINETILINRAEK